MKVLIPTLLTFFFVVDSIGFFETSAGERGDIPRHYKKILSSPFLSWPFLEGTKASINIQGAWKKLELKKQVVVAVIDTGIDPYHPLVEKSVLRNPSSSQGGFGVDFSKGAQRRFFPEDKNGHGTHIAGIIRSVFPDVKLMPLKYYSERASGLENLKAALAALRYAIDQNVDIINYSGGGPEKSAEELRLLKIAEQKGILVVAASGNNRSNIDGPGGNYYPAGYNLSNILTVTAYDQFLKILSSSNYGAKKVHIAAPGSQISSGLPMGRFGHLTGTSQATAFVSGIAAMIKGMYPHLGPEELKQVILDSGTKDPRLKNKCLSSARLNALGAVELARARYGRPKSFTVAKVFQKAPQHP